jgi:hypothetical protein
MFFSGFCVKGKRELFYPFLDDSPLVAAGFSFGAQKVWELVKRELKEGRGEIRKIQLFSPAFFGNRPRRWIEVNIEGFRKNRRRYILQFLKKAGLPDLNLIDWGCREEELFQLLTYRWERLELDGIELEVFLGSEDPIIDVEGAFNFFKEMGVVHLLNGADHFLRPFTTWPPN